MEKINLFVPKFRKKEIFEEMEECLDIGWTGLGFKTEKFESLWKNYTGFDNAHFVNSATSGLHLAFKVLKDVNKWKDGDEVITTPLTFISSNHAIVYEKLKPVFADVDNQLCLDVKSVESRITKKTKAVLFVGIGGNTGQYKKIVELCQKYKLKLILDAAHMAGTKIDRLYHSVASTKSQVGWDADVTVFSFQAVKNLPTSDSGMICFKNNDYDALARKLTWLGIDKDTYSRTNDKGTYKWEYDVIDLGYKYHGNSITASMGIVGLKYLDEDNDFRGDICREYTEHLKDVVDIVEHSDDCVSSKHLFQIKTPKRNKLMEYLNINNIYPGVHYRDNTLYSMYRDSYGTCPNSHKISEEVISLPLHLHLTKEDVEYVSNTIKKGIKTL